MTCVIKSTDNMCNHDYQLALSVATCQFNKEAELDECSKPCAPSLSSWEDARVSCASSCAAAFASSDLPLSGPSMLNIPDKVLWATWMDDRTTDASPRSARSLCDEPEDFDLGENELAENDPLKSERPARKLEWAELVDSETDDETSSLDAEGGSEIGECPPDPSPASPQLAPAPRWADISESEEEFMEGPSSEAGSLPSKDISEPSKDISEELPPSSADPQPARASRASRRARARAAAAAERGGAQAEEAGWQSAAGKQSQVAKQGKSTGKGDLWSSTNKGAGKSAGKGTNKGAGKGANQGTGKAVGKGNYASKGSGKGAGEIGGKGGGKGASEKYQCQIVIGIEEDNKFRVVRRMIGSGGENMKNIYVKSQAKLRLRGRGSKFLEGENQQESTDDLMLCISAQDKAGYEKAKVMASELIQGIHHSYRAFCYKSGKVCPDLVLEIHEGYRDGSR